MDKLGLQSLSEKLAPELIEKLREDTFIGRFLAISDQAQELTESPDKELRDFGILLKNR